MTQSLDTSADRHTPLAGIAGLEISGLTADSRAVEPGFLFAALPGVKSNGLDFIGEAARRGAVAILAPAGASLPVGAPPLPIIEDALPRRRFARMAAAFYGAQPATIAAVTGTNGKSSTVSFARQIWQQLGLSSASLGTLGIDSDRIVRPGALTTADPVHLHADLAALARSGVTHAALEASSHGLDQYRLDGVRVTVAGFASFGRDHLDYHGTDEAYLAAKARLFTEVLQPGGVAVLNADIPQFAHLSALARGAGHPVLSYGLRGREIRVLGRKAAATGQSTRVEILGRRHEFVLPLAGEFQLMNALCALGLVITDGTASDPAVAALGRLRGVRGRLELVAQHPNGAPVYVDYAHTADALETILGALRPHTRGRLIVVFGCGGDRDRGKRPLMGAVASRLADRVFVTDDNPRSEDPAAIRAAIMAASPGAIEIGDRAEAIATAIGALGPEDVLVVAGKGHEQGQIVGGETRPFDDAEIARKITADLSR